ncbi:MAG: DNA alkylation repair protein [Saprospiraceae bacterium]|jgi:3-methyladenine DNA glycosylase AlkD
MELYNLINNLCLEHADSARASGMKAYMKNQFEFFGIPSSQRKLLVKDLKQQVMTLSDDRLWELVGVLWSNPHREMQYIALDIIRPMSKGMNCTHLPVLEKMIMTKSWWDTVDSIVPNIVGDIFRSDTNCRDQYVYKWMDSPNIWLKRASIIFQLRYQKETDWNLLCEAILRNDTSKEFFVRKGQGWALRQYSKYNPLAVRQFVEANPQLSGLTKMEALRKIL